MKITNSKFGLLAESALAVALMSVHGFSEVSDYSNANYTGGWVNSGGLYMSFTVGASAVNLNFATLLLGDPQGGFPFAQQTALTYSLFIYADTNGVPGSVLY